MLGRHVQKGFVFVVALLVVTACRPYAEPETPANRELGFCAPGSPNTPVPQRTGNGDDCSEAKAREMAIQDWLKLNCSGTNDPQCPTGCAEKGTTCQKFPGDISNLKCKSRAVSASTCPGKVKYRCELAAPSQTMPIACSCTCR